MELSSEDGRSALTEVLVVGAVVVSEEDVSELIDESPTVRERITMLDNPK